jgi:hypothetical protein
MPLGLADHLHHNPKLKRLWGIAGTKKLTQESPRAEGIGSELALQNGNRTLSALRCRLTLGQRSCAMLKV